ncbi:MAG: hypothetical protein HQL59_09110, partial [Magnetococcales bacterium]|nr:hypothetical protein [Magnetococcales bacterium]
MMPAGAGGGASPLILGIWDGHDAGAALLQDGSLLAAENEERLSRRKLEIHFPERAIAACLETAGVDPSRIRQVAASTTDVAKTLARLYPASKERYYRLRRRLDPPSLADRLLKPLKYRVTEWPGNALTRHLSRRHLQGRLRAMGFADFELSLFDHHLCHAAAAACFSGFDPVLVVTLDGVGDALSGSVGVLRAGRWHRLATIAAGDSLGIFFEHVTNLLNMRELEDEGKVMALADWAVPVADADNPLLTLFRVEGLTVRGRLRGGALKRFLAATLWRTPAERFAGMAQRTLEYHVATLVARAVEASGLGDVALAGGVFANIKVNGAIRRLPGVRRCCVFPHMGDGGLAVG